ncbi:MAG: N-acetylmuramoyl-L-alanine amidase [Verrucomicrobiota bacterium]|nr:N-acetylmuramoyl-L-alanine amidase [Verrucomicrobiota bacterium]
MFRSLVTRGLALLLLGSAAAGAVDEELPNESAANLSTLGRAPDWSELEKYQGSMTHDEFVSRLENVYGRHGYDPELIKVEPDLARILVKRGGPGYFVLHFAKSEADRLPVAHWWKAPGALPPSKGAPLAGFHIALDPGHLGGTWAEMEERWFQIDRAPPVKEGDMTLQVARLLATRLESLGAKVSLVREKAEPITPYRPSDFEEIARQFLLRAGVEDPRTNFDGPADPEKEQTVGWQRELLFYRNSEIRRRASLVNYRLQPDLVISLHFNAEPWGDPNHPTLVPNNHLHLLVNGAYLPPELELDDERFEMLQKLLSGAYPEELALAESIAGTMAKATGLPPYRYKTENVTPVGTSGYVFARNLMATRLYRCPTVYLEPYVMNSREVFARVQAGDYDGTRRVAGKKRPSIFREYVDGVVDGVLEYFQTTRPQL